MATREVGIATSNVPLHPRVPQLHASAWMRLLAGKDILKFATRCIALQPSLDVAGQIQMLTKRKVALDDSNLRLS